MSEPPGILRPRVSFVVPTYNYARFVAEAVDSLLDQDFQALEVIVIDDCSSDNTAEVLSRYAGDPRVRVIRHETNRGHIRTYNEGLAMATGEFVGLLSADDVCLRRDAVSRQVAIFDRDADVGFVYSALSYVDADRKLLEVVQRWPDDSIHEGLEEFRSLAFSNYVPASGTLVRARCHERLGYYDERLPHAGDWDLWLRLAAQHRVGYVADACYGWRLHTGNMHELQIRPGQADRDHVLTITKAFEALPASAPHHVRALKPVALRRLAIRAIDLERRWDRIGPGWRRALTAPVHHPGAPLDREYHAALAKLTVRTLLGRDRLAQLTARRRVAMSAKAASEPAR
jgi:glycosyltransferase involved in cell wall biosynthesis